MINSPHIICKGCNKQTNHMNLESVIDRGHYDVVVFLLVCVECLEHNVSFINRVKGCDAVGSSYKS